MVEGTGFEPVYATRPDLQSGAFNHSATPPKTGYKSPTKAGNLKPQYGHLFCVVNGILQLFDLQFTKVAKKEQKHKELKRLRS